MMTASAHVVLTQPLSLADNLIKQQCLHRTCGFSGIIFIIPRVSPRISISSAIGILKPAVWTGLPELRRLLVSWS